MNLKSTLTLLGAFTSQALFAQFSIKPSYFEATGVSNQGWVVGYETQAGPYSIWNPDSAVTTNIDGLAPGQGIGSQAHFSDDGRYVSGTSHVAAGAEMSRYDFAIGQWIPLGNLGLSIDSTLSGGFAISGDGNTVVGNSWADTASGFAYTHAVAWNPTEGLMDLGSLFSVDGRSTRANAASYDGSVVVGWQDFNGPWKSAVWRKNPAGGYFPNEYILIDTAGSSSDEFNQLGECSAVSGDGNWIGGYGDYANNGEPWIWSESTGVINLGTLIVGGTGYVSAINTDGTVVVGWFNGFFGDPQVPFIWTPTGGLQNLNTYINTTLGFSTGSIQVYTANCMSSNAEYIAGYGVDTASFMFYTYRLHVASTSGIASLATGKALTAFPNPATDLLTIYNVEQSDLEIRSIEGKVVYSSHSNPSVTSIDISKFAAGIYWISAKTNSNVQTVRFVKQ
jgi:hypothetical protein